MTTKRIAPRIPRIFSCLLGPDNETGRWIAHCLDFDLVTSGKTEDDAWKHLLRIVKMHVEHCFTHRPEGLQHEADPTEWTLFKALKQQTEFIRSEKISLTLVPPPEDESLNFFWIKGVETKPSADLVQRVH
jgi:hypothetical protein